MSGCSSTVRSCILSLLRQPRHALLLGPSQSQPRPIPYRYSCGHTFTVSPRHFLCTDASTGVSNEKQPFSGEIPMDQLEFRYSRSGGPGGQHVNKVATKVELRFNLEKANWIPDWIKSRIAEKERNRITKHGDLIMTSDKTRKQILNQADCLNRLRTIIFDASVLPKEPTPEEIALAEKRKKKRATLILKEKRHHSLKKSNRGSQGYAAL